jgi:hypothetical protein
MRLQSDTPNNDRPRPGELHVAVFQEQTHETGLKRAEDLYPSENEDVVIVRSRRTAFPRLACLGVSNGIWGISRPWD